MLSYSNCACTLKFNDGIIAYGSSHCILCTIKYNVYIQRKLCNVIQLQGLNTDCVVHDHLFFFKPCTQTFEFYICYLTMYEIYTKTASF